MRPNGESLISSATDLSNFLSCRHLTALEMAVARGKRQRAHWHDPLLDILFQRGLSHEKAYVDSLRAEVPQIVDLSALKEPSLAVAATLEAMKGVGARIQRGGRAVAGMLTIATAGGS